MNSKKTTFIIAEAGVNHNGELQLAKRLIDAAAESHADAVKFQSFHADKLVSRHAEKADYQMRTTDSAESQFDMLRNLELSESDHRELLRHAQSRRIEFLSTPFDRASLNLLTRQLGIRTIKMSSGDITNAPFLLAVARAADKIILSTGMSTIAEIEAALSVLAFGFTESNSSIYPRGDDFRRALRSQQGKLALKDRVTLLHCTSEYPAPVGEVNLRAMITMTERFRLPTGYSDHTVGIHIALAAVALGAVVIEKHFTLDKNLPGPDHSASIEPSELRSLISQIRDIEQSLGDGVKRPTKSELKNRAVVRRSLVAAKDIAKGDTFTTENLSCKRIGHGTSPFEYWEVLGQTADRPYKADEVVDV